jgi:hypothetical protein
MDWTDLNALRIVVMLAGLALFLALWRHTWSRQREGEHALAAMSPFSGDVARDAPAVAGAPNTTDRKE